MPDASSAQLFDVVDGVRRRWRLARVLRGGAVVAVSLVALLLTAAFVLDAVAYAPGAVIAARILAITAAVVLVTWFIVRPFLPKPGDEQVALYVEEHEPSLEGALVAAVEVSKGASANAGPLSIGALVRRMAMERTHAIDDGRRVDAKSVTRAAMTIAGAVAVLLIVLTLSADRLRHGLRALLVPWESAEAVNPFRLDIKPGDATIAKGGSVLVTAHAVGFSSDGAELWMRTSDTAQWTHIPMSADSTSNFTARVLDVSVPTQYLVETSGLRSRVFHLAVADLPYAKRLDLEYRYPAYTGLPVLKVDSTGDIAAPAGTMVRIRVTPTMPTNTGRIVVDGGDTLSLSPMSDGTLIAMMRVTKPGFYRVELSGPRGDLLTASLSYAVDVIPDRPPTVRFLKPGRDQRVLAVDEVYTEARAEDDYGVAKLELMYSVNGAEEKSIPLSQATSRVIKDIAAGHTFMLEDYQLQPGDVVSYYAKATDNDAVNGAKSATTDIYFMQVRPYAQDYRQDQQGGGGGGGGGGGQQQNPGRLSQRQREIIAGTFNANRDSSKQLATQFTEDVATLRLAQQKLREDVSELQTNLVERGVTDADSALLRISKILPLAAAEMDTAEVQLSKNHVKGALQPQQKALQQLQRAEAEFRNVRVSMGQQGGGGGGGGGGQQEPEDLADLFELRQDRMRNQYESMQRAEADSSAQQAQKIDETAERLKQLAARAQQENERARRKADSLSRGAASGTSGGDAQRQMAQEAEQAARQLERLARERESQSLADAARKLNEAASAMRQAAASSGTQGAAQSAAAMDKLKEARRLMDQDKDSRAKQAFDDVANTGRRLGEEQKKVADDVNRATSAQGADRQQILDDVGRRKNAMADSAKALASKLDNLAREARKDQPQAAREIEEASDTLRGRHIENNLRVTSNMGRFPQNQWNYNEGVIGSGIEQLNKALEEARAAAQSGRSANDTDRKNAEAMDKTRNLLRGMESMDERARQQQDQRNVQQGQQGNQQGQQQGQQQGNQPGQQQGSQRGQQQGNQLGQQGQQPGQQQGQQQGQGQQGQQPGQQQGQQGQQGEGRGQGQAQQGGQMGGGNAQMGGGGAQWNRELGQRLADARELRRDLVNRGVDVKQLDQAIGNLERLRSPLTLSDPRAEKELRTQVVEGLRAFEFQLGEKFGVRSNERVLVDRTGEIPAEYRKYVEEYYRSLGKTKPK